MPIAKATIQGNIGNFLFCRKTRAKDQVKGFLEGQATEIEDAAYLCFEVIETGVVEDYERTAAVLTRFRGAGYRIAIDDFGSGYSSLQHFRTLPADDIKIDRSFVSELLTDRANQHITQTIIELAHRFGKTVIAEGIESEETAQLLREQGCDVGQGYHFGRPAGLDTTARLLVEDA